MKIKLIYPKWPKLSPQTEFHLPPHGLSMVASALMIAGHEVRQSDILIHGNTLDALAEEVRRFNPELIGISIRNIDNVKSNERTVLHRRRKRSGEVDQGCLGCKYSAWRCRFFSDAGADHAGDRADYGVVWEGE